MEFMDNRENPASDVPSTTMTAEKHEESIVAFRPTVRVGLASKQSWHRKVSKPSIFLTLALAEEGFDQCQL